MTIFRQIACAYLHLVSYKRTSLLEPATGIWTTEWLLGPCDAPQPTCFSSDWHWGRINL